MITALSRIRLLRADDAVVGINRRNVDLVYANNERRYFPYADDKLLAKKAMRAHGVSVPENLAVCRGLFEVEATLDKLATLDSFVVKPASGSGGDGILVVAGRSGDERWTSPRGREVTREELRKHLADIVFGAYSKQLEDVAFVEPRIVGHEAFARLFDAGLCDVRVIVLRGVPVMAMVRVPTRESGGRANLHQGGIGLAVDMHTGRIVRAFHRKKSITHHPESGAELLGWTIPSFPELVDIAKRAASSVPLGYLGVDIVVDQEGRPFVLEINARPGLEIQNVHARGLGTEIESAGEEVTPPARRGGGGGGKGSAKRKEVGDRAWPILLAFTAMLVGSLALEAHARRRESPPMTIAVHSAGSGTTGDEDAPTSDDAPVETDANDAELDRARMLAHRGQLAEAIEAFRASIARTPNDPDRRIELAFWLLGAKRTSDARTELALAATARPDDPKIALYEGHALAAEGDAHGAEQKYRRALTLRPSYGSAATALARLLVRGRRYAEAISVVEPATRHGSNDERARALVVHGAALIRVGRRAEALADFEKAIERAPSHAELRIRIGRAWLDSNDTRDVARAIGAFEGAIRIAPDLATAHSGLGRAFEKANDDAEAERAYERCLAIDPSYTFARRRLLRLSLANRDFRKAESHAARLLAEDDGNAEHHFLAGLVAAREGRVDEARTRYETAIARANGDYPEALFNLGQLENRAGRRDAAIAAYEAAIAHRPRYTQAMSNLGLVYAAADRPADAEAIWRRALAIDPRYATAMVNLGDYLVRAQRYDEAVSFYERALEARGGRHPQTEIDLARAFERMGRVDEAKRRLVALADREPRLVAAALALGETLERARDFVGAKASLARAVAIDPENERAVAALGRVESSLGELDSARTHLRAALDIDASDASVRLRLADVSRRLGDPQGCAREAEVAAADPSEHQAAIELRARCSVR